MRKINIFDTTLRDGEQSAGINLNHSEKMEVARQLERLGVDIIEAGFPASSKGDFRAVKEISDTIRNCSVTGLSRSNVKDIDISWDALKGGAEPRLHLFLATSPIHMQYKLKMSPEQVLETAVASVKYAREKFPIVQFSAEDAGRSELPFLAEIVKAVIDAGATVINIPDTVGYLPPSEYGSIFKYLRENVPNIGKAILSTHCHDDLGMAVANSLSGVENGAGQVECTINGIGGRAGNAALEEIAVALHIRNDFYQANTGINLQQIKKTSALVSKLTGVIVPPNKAVVGKNAFAHESGIHQDGVLKEKSTYEIISPELVGVSSNDMVLGKHSGRHAFRNRMEELGYSLSTEEINSLFVAFKELADKKKEITDDDLIALMYEEKLGSAINFYELKSLQVQYGTNHMPTATIGMTTPSGEEVHEACTGSGSVEAIYNTLERIIGSPVRLNDFRVQANTAGRDALAEVFVKILFQDMTSSGRGTAQDVLGASAKAYINAINRILVQKQYREDMNNTK